MLNVFPSHSWIIVRPLQHFLNFFKLILLRCAPVNWLSFWHVFWKGWRLRRGVVFMICHKLPGFFVGISLCLFMGTYLCFAWLLPSLWAQLHCWAQSLFSRVHVPCLVVIFQELVGFLVGLSLCFFLAMLRGGLAGFVVAIRQASDLFQSQGVVSQKGDKHDPMRTKS